MEFRRKSKLHCPSTKVSPFSYLGQTQGLTGDSKSMYEVGNPKSEVDAPMHTVSRGPFYVIARLLESWD